MKLRKSFLSRFSLEEMMAMENIKKTERNIVKSYAHTYGHDIEELVSGEIFGERNVELALGNILIECDGYDKQTHTLTEVKSNYGSKVHALERACETAFLIFAICERLNLRKVQTIRVIGVNNKITRKYGMDYSIHDLSFKDFKNRAIPKIRGVKFYYDHAQRNAEAYVSLMKEVNDYVA